MSANGKAAYLAFVASAGLVAICFSCSQVDNKRMAQNEVRIIASAVMNYDAAFPGVLDDAQLTNAVRLYFALASKSSGVRFLPEHDRWDRAQRLVDPWGTDYKVKYVTKNRSNGTTYLELSVSSAGANRRMRTDDRDEISYAVKVP